MHNIAKGSAGDRTQLFEVAADAFQKPDCCVRAILAERSFWEKATILAPRGAPFA